MRKGHAQAVVMTQIQRLDLQKGERPPSRYCTHESGRGLPQSKTWRKYGTPRMAQLLDLFLDDAIKALRRGINRVGECSDSVRDQNHAVTRRNGDFGFIVLGV